MDHSIVRFILTLLLFQWLRCANGIIGYDCGSASSNITTISLLTIEECDIPPIKINTTRIRLQLLQANDFKSVSVMQCKVEVDRLVKRCGMFSHTMDVANGKFAYIHEVTQQACLSMHNYGSFSISSTIITGLKVNQTTTRPVLLAGKLDSNGACSGSAFTDDYGSWSDVVVLATVKITLQDYRATVKIDNNQIMLRSGIHCDLKAGQCTDIEGGNTFWKSVPEDTCKTTNYGVLYDGHATKMLDSSDSDSQVIYSITTKDTTFALASRGEIKNCGYTLIKTEHPKLFILDPYPGISIFKAVRDPTNMDIFTYMNSKFVYVEKHFRTQLSQVYRNILLQQCNLEQKTLQNALAIATQAPDIFAYHLMKGPGYTSVLAGEVVHIIKCVPVDVQVAPTHTCYNQLPVLRGNETYYLTPQTHLLLRQGTEVSCSSMAPAMYQLGDAWYKLTPKPVESIPPTILKPMTRPEWKYTSPGSLATSGIYSQADLDDLRDYVMFPAERPAVLNAVARGMMGHAAAIHGGSFANLFSEETLEKLATSAWERIWGRFQVFGNISAGIIGVFLIIRGIKMLLDTIIHGFALHSVYGCSVHLLGAIWDSLTHLLILLGGKKKATKAHQTPSDLTELQPVGDNPVTIPPQQSIGYQHLRSTLPQEESSSYSLQLKA